MRGRLACIVAGIVASAFASADISYVSWDAAHSTGSSVSGTIDLGGGNTVGVTLTGPLYFVQGSGTTNLFTPASTYEGAGVPNAPETSDLVGIIGGGSSSYTVTFDKPVNNLVMDIVSLGRGGEPVDYNFDHNFTLVNEGVGAFGGTTGDLAAVDSNTVEGTEGNGVLLFNGNLDSLSWTVPQAEVWHGFTFGIQGEAQAVPEPATMAVLGIGALGLLRKRKRKA